MKIITYYLRFFVPAIAITLALFFFVDNLLYQSSLTFLVDDQSKKLDLKKAYFSNYFEPALEDIELLANQTSLQNFLENATNERELQNDYVLLSDIHKSYVQIRILDDSGIEVIRVDHINDSSVVVQDSLLQDKSSRPYFIETMRYAPDQIYVSDIELNQEKGVIQTPYQPVLRISKPLFGKEGERKGMIITNYNAATFLEDFSEYYKEDEEFFFLNENGYFLAAPAAFPLWGFMVPELQSDHFAKYFTEVWDRIQRTKKGYTINQNGFFAYEEIRFDDLNYSSINPDVIISDNSWIIATHLDETSTKEILYAHRRNLLLAMLFFLTVILAFLFFLAKSRQEIVQRDTELVDLNTNLNIKNKELQQFIYISSHDLQEPLRTISSYTEILEQEYKTNLDEDGQRFLNYLSTSADRLINLVRGILQYSKIGNLSEKEEANLEDLISEILRDLQFSIDECNAQITIQKLDSIIGNKMGLRILFQNLISNSIKFRKPDQTPIIEIKSTRTNDQTLIYISDNGIGIDEKYQEKIFQIFQRLHTQSEYPGNGIGLGLCKKIVELHQGTISFISNAELGTTFTIAIPNLNE